MFKLWFLVDSDLINSLVFSMIEKQDKNLWEKLFSYYF